jgi:hypothetical protein
MPPRVKTPFASPAVLQAAPLGVPLSAASRALASCLGVSASAEAIYVVNGDPIYAGRAPVGTDLARGPPEHVAAGDLVIEGIGNGDRFPAWHSRRARLGEHEPSTPRCG